MKRTQSAAKHELAFLGSVNIVESRGCGVGTLCLDFVTYVKQDPFTLKDRV